MIIINHQKLYEMKNYLEIIVQAQPADEKMVQSIMNQMLNTFPIFLKIIERTSTIRMTEFSILYYDLHYFLEKDLKMHRRYSVKDLLSFAKSFDELYNKVLKVSELKDQYALYVYEEAADKFRNWFTEVTESLPVSR